MVVPMVKCSISCCVLWILLLLLVTAAAVLAITAGILHSSLTSAQVRLQHFDLIEENFKCLVSWLESIRKFTNTVKIKGFVCSRESFDHQEILGT